MNISLRETQPHQLPKDTVLRDRYRIEGVLGEGGFGITYRSFDETLSQQVAIKEYFPHMLVTRYTRESRQVTVCSGEGSGLFERGKQHFLQEARILARFREEPNILSVFDYFEDNGTAYIVMEYLEGEDLLALIERRGRMPFPEALALMMPVITALEKLHAAGLVHRDISPSNIRILPDKRIKLLDFGSVRTVDYMTDRSRTVISKPGYSPIEQYRSRGEQGPWVDVYSLCATIYHMITGAIPDDSLQRVLLDELKKPSELGAVISPAEEAVLLRGLAVDEKMRYRTVTELKNAFLRASGNFPADAVSGEGPLKASSNAASSGFPSGAAPLKDAPDSRPDPREAVQGSKAASKKKLLIPIIAAAGILLLAAAIGITIFVSRKNAEGKDTASEKTAEAAVHSGEETGAETLSGEQTEAEPADGETPGETASADEEPSEETEASDEKPSEETGSADGSGSAEIPSDELLLPAEILCSAWGAQSWSSDGFDHYITQTLNGIECELRAFPDLFGVDPSQPGTIFLIYTDRYDYQFKIYAEYAVDNNMLTLKVPKESIDNSSYEPLSDELVYHLSPEDLKNGTLVLKSPAPDSDSDSVGYRNYADSVSADRYFQGAASDPDHCYKNIASLNIILDSGQYSDPALTEEDLLDYLERRLEAAPETVCKSCQMIDTDGGYTLDAYVSDLETTGFAIEWNRKKIPYNGRIQEDTSHGELTVPGFINCYPFGFIIYDEEEEELYFYTNPPREAILY